MIKKVYIFLFLLSGISVKSQSPLAKNGTIITAENVKIEFNDIRLVNGKFLYYDLQTNTEKQIEIKNYKCMKGYKYDKSYEYTEICCIRNFIQMDFFDNLKDFKDSYSPFDKLSLLTTYRINNYNGNIITILN